MPPPLPPLPALRAFDAAARHLSISRAADELYLTHGAVSHQIKNLEAQLGVRLIARHGRGIVLTPSGAAFSAKLGVALAQLESAVAEIRPAAAGPLKITALPSFAARWLVPRLPDFRARHPEIELHLHTAHALADFARDGVDLAIRYGQGAWPGATAEKLMDEELVPVCSPDFNHGQPPQTPQEILRAPLLRDTHVRWANWFAEMGMAVREPKNTFVYTDSGLLVQAAVAGQGVALARAVLARDDLAAGSLVRLPGAALPAGHAYYIVFPTDPPLPPHALAFVAWLRQSAA
ncbi:transcriptional regulator GcvA [Duganella sp. sic0402]|uniref:transcriptional regulator GcvA n=1 Tax=Duganella sp. sic0402 TaxID=2854786 RepID=UPI001C476E1E|nr:transcriptional regulator GcvA [Duganella sp. sic0402]MBV7537522.1 transcriptional regulator GcvA [Duganella sp. sic0402]